MKNAKRFLCAFCLLCGCFAAGTLSAQTFRRITSMDDLEEGAYYVLGGYCRKAPDSVYVMASQEKTGLGIKRREARKVKPDSDGRIHVADGGTAIFELVKVNSSTYAFRDIVLDAWLAYSGEKVYSYNTPLYTLTDEELENTSEKLCRTFEFQAYKQGEGRTTSVYTEEEIENGWGHGYQFGLSVNYDEIFRLYWQDQGDTLFIYKKEDTCFVADMPVSGDWAFRGDWLADSLSRVDFSLAKRIDFTEVSLSAAGAWSAVLSLPGEYVWTYVRTGEAACLPEGWPNVIEIGNKEENGMQGRAATRIVGGDSCALGSKYAFEVPEGTGIEWYRTVSSGGGWFTVGLPFAPEGVSWAAADGEALSLERLAFEKIVDGGAVFLQVAEDVPWEAGRAYLWRPVASREGTACFHASRGEVLASPAATLAEGFYPTFSRMEIDGRQAGMRVLDDRGGCFVRPEAGSWLAPGRGYLKCGNANGAVIRLLRGEATGMQSAGKMVDSSPVPVYTIGGKKMGVLKLGGQLPDDWPKGIYVTPLGKVVHP